MTVSVDAPGQFSGESVAELQATSAQVPATFRAVRAVTTVGVLQLSVLLVMLLRSKVLALLLKPEGVGVVSTLDQLVQFVAQVSALSVIAAPTRFIARAAVDDTEAVTAMYSLLLKLLLLSTFAGTTIAVGLLFLQPHVLGPGFHDYRSLAVIAVLTAPLLALSGFFANVSAATKGYLTTSRYVLGTAVVSLAAAFIGVRTAGIAGLYYGNLIAGTLGVLALAAYLHARVPLNFRVRGSRVRDAVRQHPDIISYCSTSYVLSFAQPLAFLIVRSVMLQRLGPAEAGYFQAAFTLSSIASAILTQAVRVYLEPRVNTATQDRTRIAAANEFQRTFAVLILVGTLPLVLFPRDIISVLFTRAFTPVSAVVFVFVLADCLFLCNQVYATVLMAVDDFRAFFQAHLAGHVCLCVCVWLVTGRFGLTGIAWSFFVSRALVFVLIQGLLFKRHRLTMTVRTGGIVVYAMAALATAAFVFGSGPTGVAGTALRFLAFGAVSVGTLAFLTRDERVWLGAVCRRLVQVR